MSYVLLFVPATTATLRVAAANELEPARAHGENGFKIELAQRVMVGVLSSLLEGGDA